MRRIALFPLAALVLAACQDSTEPTGPLEQVGPQADIQDAVHNSGNQFFFFLPPMVADPNASGVFDGSLAPEVEICEWTGSCATSLATFTTTTGPGSETVRVSTVDEHYIVNWHTDLFGLDATKTYRIIVSVGAKELGHADVDMVSSGKELKNVDTGEFIALKDGRTLPIKFRIEEGALPACVAAPSGLVSWWPGDGNAIDIGVGGNNGTFSAATFATGFVTSGNGQAFSFDGVDDIVDMGNVLDFGLTSFTADAWIKTASTGGSKRILGTFVSGVAGYDFSIRDNGQLIVFLSTSSGGLFSESTVGSVPVNVFHHVAVTVDRAANDISLFIDGVETSYGVKNGTFGTGFGPTDDIASTTAFAVGNRVDGANPFLGLIDEVEIFDGVLSAPEIKSIFDAGSEGKCKT